MTEKVGSVQRPSMEGPPGGFRAVLFTDIQDSTALWEAYPSRMPEALARHHRIVEESVVAVGGTVVKNIGDGFVAAFPDVVGAVTAALRAQVALSVTGWDLDGDTVSVRMAVDAGVIEVRDNDVGGPVVNRCARLMDVAHGGQILVSDDVVDRLEDSNLTLVDLGSFSLKGIAEPVGAHRVVLPTDETSRPGAMEPGGIGWAVRGFELRERIGAGVAGVVYRAHQRSVGREVAIKLIRPEFANDRRFVHRFETEAQFIARLEHPHIVSLYDYWRDPDGAYLVMRWLRGGSLRQALERGPWREQSTVRLLQQVGSALAYAHRRGVIHRDVRPSNILLDEEGNGYLSDFGIASRPLAEGGRSVSTSSEYRSPEEIAGRPLTEATDQFCLAMVAHELLTGHRLSVPFRFELDDAVTSGFAKAIRRASADDPADRFPSVEAFLAAVGPTLDLASVEADVSRNPFKGLRPFFEADAADFFGRDQLVDRLVAAVAANRLVTVVGASGSGKSSAVRAGLVPALRRGAIAGSERWFVADLYPGAHPFDELASALLSIATRPLPNLVEELTGDTRALGRIVKQLVPSDAELVLVLDQFEELFTRASAADRAAFLDAITDLVSDPHARARIVVTLRADFYDRPLANSKFARLIEPGLVSVPAPTREELTAAILEPSQAVGLSVDPALVELILAEIVDQPGALPLLQYTLTELFDARMGSRLSSELFTLVGGVRGSLSRRAEAIFDSLDPAARIACEQIFLRLVSVEEDAEDTRRRITRASLEDLGIDTGSIEAVLDAYGRHRLLTFDHDPTSRDPTVELAHEALLRSWSRLASWIDDRRQDLITEHHLAAAVSEWEESGRNPDHLLSGSRLTRYEEWSRQTGITPTDTERIHLAEARLQQNEREARRHRVRRMVTAGFAAIAVIATALAIYALAQQQRAERENRSALARELAAAASANLEDDPERSMLLGLEAAAITKEADGYVLREAQEALHEALQRSRTLGSLRMEFQDWYAFDFSPDGRLHVGTDRGNGVEATVAERGLELTSLPYGFISVAASSEMLATVQQDAPFTIALRDRDHNTRGLLKGHSGPISGMEFSPDGRLLASIAWDGTTRVWDVETGQPVAVLPHDCVAPECQWINGLAFDPTGTRLAVAQFDVTVWEIATETAVFRHEFDEWPGAGSVDFTSDGTRLAVGLLLVGRVDLLDATTGERTLSLYEHSGSAFVAASPDPAVLATAGLDGTIRLWRLTDYGAKELAVLAGHDGSVVYLRFDRSGEWLASGSSGSVFEARVWDTSETPHGEILAVSVGEHWFAAADFAPNGVLASSGIDGRVSLWDRYSGEHIGDLDGPAGYQYGFVTSVDVSPDGRLLAASGAAWSDEDPDGVGWVRVWSLETSELVSDVAPSAAEVAVQEVAFSPDGRFLAIADLGRGAFVYEVSTWREVFSLEDHIDQSPPDNELSVHAVGISPSGELLAVQRWDAETDVFDLQSGEKVVHVPHRHNLTGDVEFIRDGAQLLTAGQELPRVWDTKTGELLFAVDSQNATGRRASLSQDGSLIVAGLRDGSVRIWDSSTGAEVLTLRGGHGSEVQQAVFSPDGTQVASTDSDGRVNVWTVDVDQLIEMAERRLTRDFTDDECRTYLHLESCSER